MRTTAQKRKHSPEAEGSRRGIAAPQEARQELEIAGLAVLYRSDPRYAHAVVEVEPRVTRLLEAMLQGMLS